MPAWQVFLEHFEAGSELYTSPPSLKNMDHTRGLFVRAYVIHAKFQDEN